jgi:hypothetical protein
MRSSLSKKQYKLSVVLSSLNTTQVVNGLKFYCRTEVVLALKWRQDLSSVVKLKFQDNAQGGRGASATGRATQNLSSAADEGTPDEAIHVAAAMQLAGFRSVVGTLWEMVDQDGPFVAREFYGHVFREGSTSADFTDAAVALHGAVRALRKKDPQSVSRWIDEDLVSI